MTPIYILDVHLVLMAQLVNLSNQLLSVCYVSTFDSDVVSGDEEVQTT